FFQAEDGIRDFHVTGVQTCALPISTRSWYQRLIRRTGVGSASISWTGYDCETASAASRTPISSCSTCIAQSASRKRVACSCRHRSEERRVGNECICREATERGKIER